MVILGGGSAGESVASALVNKTVAVVEAERVGGECPFVACMPSKAMLHSAKLRRLVTNTAPSGSAKVGTEHEDDHKDAKAAYAMAISRRDEIAENRDDFGHAQELTANGTILIRGEAFIAGPNRIQVSGQELNFEHLVVATGSAAAIAPIEGLDAVPCWSSDEALSSDELPKSIAILGAGPVGCELAQIYASYGVATILIERSETVLASENSLASNLVRDALQATGVQIHTGTRIVSAKAAGHGAVLLSDSGIAFDVSRVLSATGRKPNVAGLGLENIGIKPTKTGIAIDEFCRALGHPNIWAAGDVTGVAPFTHTANYQGRIVAANIGGKQKKANYDAIPRSVYTSPSVCSVGLSSSQAIEKGFQARTAQIMLSATAKASTDDATDGYLELVADMESGVLIGASAGGPRSEEWIGEATLAIRAKIPLEILAEVIHPFPSFSEAYESATRQLLQPQGKSSH